MNQTAPGEPRPVPLRKSDYFHAPLNLNAKALLIFMTAWGFAIPTGLVLWLLRPADPFLTGLLLLAFFTILLFVISIIHYHLRSPFEVGRERQGLYGGMADFPGFPSPARFILYDDGIEVKAMFTSLFLPYDKLEIEEISGSTGRKLKLHADLPRVPATIGFSTFSHDDELLAKLRERNKPASPTEPGT